MYTDNGVKTFTATTALERARRVKLSSGYGNAVEYAAAADDYIGVTLDAAAITEPVAVKIKRASQGTVEVEAAGVITAGATIYGAADGKVSASSTGTDKFGKALEAASGSGAVIESLMDD
jgi:putative effector of murein hydrolase